MSICTINMINFIRGVEPRMSIDLVEPVRNQIKLNQKYGIKNTFLIQYDALINPEFTDLLIQTKNEKTEFGLWLEIVKPLVETVGIKWRGRPGFAWDWHVNPGFLMAYTNQERERLIDEAMHKFKELFGEYPRSVGCWLIDSHSMQYMSENYPVEAFCICREQWGTDGYTLWGGYYDQGYYPSRHNMLSPAQNKDCQVDVPTFRMLGFDPLDGYDDTNPMDKPSCITMEPCWPCGQDKGWVEWYLKNRIENENLGFGYIQIGQENSFGWEEYGAALEQQVELLLELENKGNVVFETLSETGRNFKRKYSETPPTAVSALGDFRGDERSTVWYNCKNYRANLHSENGKVLFRDIHIFDEKYPERFENDICTEHSCTYDTLPFVDGYLCSDDKCRAGLYLNGKTDILNVEKCDDGILKVELKGENKNTSVIFRENSVTVLGDVEAVLEMSDNKRHFNAINNVFEKSVSCSHNGFDYNIALKKGSFALCDGKLTIKSENGELIVLFG